MEGVKASLAECEWDDDPFTFHEDAVHVYDAIQNGKVFPDGGRHVMPCLGWTVFDDLG